MLRRVPTPFSLAFRWSKKYRFSDVSRCLLGILPKRIRSSQVADVHESRVGVMKGCQLVIDYFSPHYKYTGKTLPWNYDKHHYDSQILNKWLCQYPYSEWSISFRPVYPYSTINFETNVMKMTCSVPHVKRDRLTPVRWQHRVGRIHILEVEVHSSDLNSLPFLTHATRSAV